VQSRKVIQITETDSSRENQRANLPGFRNNELLAGIGDDAYRQIQEKIGVIRMAPGETIFQENDPGDSLYLIAEGAVKISKRGRGGQQETLAHLMERDFFGEMALVDHGLRSAQASAERQSVLGRIDEQTWSVLLQVAPHEVLSNFTRAITKRLRQNNQNFIEQMMRTERLSLLGTTISSIVHDLNNPIGCILGACAIIQSKSHDELTDKMARIVREAVDKMRVMTGELIDFSRGNTHLRVEPMTIDDLLQELQPDFSSCGPQIEVIIDARFQGTLRVDRHRLLRVFGNIIRNAREAMKSSSRPQLRFVAAQSNDLVRFEISDTGCGIPNDILPRVFEPFVTHGKTNGTGLGLAISKAVIEAHRGTITVQSNEQGTTFTVELPG